MVRLFLCYSWPIERTSDAVNAVTKHERRECDLDRPNKDGSSSPGGADRAKLHRLGRERTTGSLGGFLDKNPAL
ncbi:hypothetical protein TRAPUB_8270 [Trametes pubescens]|uniref:Uncharacterized protein n=1 Tax=Trametes pubescens TaxID=154538 RepID=A0A1M2W5S5_TRAPU|nr:hypothetical protein TRAPUB_8270 [Trametes pubescens]